MDEDVARLLLAPVQPDPELILATEQCRAGRALLYWSQGKLARRARVAKSTVLDFETGRRTPLAANRRRTRDAFVAGEIVFIDAGDARAMAPALRGGDGGGGRKRGSGQLIRLHLPRPRWWGLAKRDSRAPLDDWDQSVSGIAARKWQPLATRVFILSRQGQQSVEYSYKPRALMIVCGQEPIDSRQFPILCMILACFS